ncbi:MAG: hypothetical protein IJP37_03515 [Clostridia bacterium]|nr:hypothetical protein [Clostridia bacterium]MBR0026209.1 hypothetical protein [Clostridia bacterium]
MKKIAIFFLVFLTFVLVGCSVDTPVEESPAPEPTASGSASLGVPNPLSASTVEAMCEETGCSLSLPADVFEELTVTRINTEPATYSLDYGYNGITYQFRLQKSHEMDDLSGMYFNWTTVIVNEDPAYEISLNGDGQGICLWQDEEFTYSLSMAEQASEELLKEMYLLLMR